MQTYIFTLSLTDFLGGSWTKRIWAKLHEIQGDFFSQAFPHNLYAVIYQECNTE